MIKKTITLIALLLGLNAQAISPQDIVGEWTCKINYPNLNVQSIDVIDFQKDGSTVGTGMLFIGLDNTFTYESKHSGRWSLNDNILSEISTDYRFIKIHSSQTMKRLATNKELREMEQHFFQTLGPTANADITKFRIYQYSHDQMSIDHLWENGASYPGFCKRSESLE